MLCNMTIKDTLRYSGDIIPITKGGPCGRLLEGLGDAGKFCKLFVITGKFIGDK